MALSELTSPRAVEGAIAEFDDLGREAFLAKYGFGRARRYFVRRNGSYYDSKAIIGAAVGIEHPTRGPMSSAEFSGGEHGAKAKLEELGFEVVARPGLAAADTMPLRAALELALSAQSERRPREWSDDLQKVIAVTLPNAIRVVVGQDFRVKGSAGAGNQAEIPWVSVMPPGTKGASEGRYVVYLFAADGSKVYLALSQAVSGQEKRSLAGLAETLRRDAGPHPELLQQIDLGAAGGLGERYALATAYAVEYLAGSLPPAASLEADLSRFLEILDVVIDAEPQTQRAWIFQANPTIYDIDRAIQELPRIEWTVRQHRRSVHAGDRVYLWRSGRDAGIIAIGRIESEPAEAPPDDSEDRFYLRREDFAKVEARVKIAIERPLDSPLLKPAIRSDPVLKDLGILQFANATVHDVKPAEDARLRALLAVEVIPQEAFDVDAIIAAATRAPRGLLLDEQIYASVFSALHSGKHVILTGPPGTAKTTLAEAVAEAAAGAGLCSGHVLTTATADWTTYETIGGLKPTHDGQLAFSPGHFLDAIDQDKWLVIDELNRSNFDRAFGQLFTVLSGQAVQLPYSRNESAGRLTLVPDGAPIPIGVDVLRIPSSWRVIATMNVFDKSLLFEMSFALMRRFAFIEVASPGDEIFRELITDAADGISTVVELVMEFMPLRQSKDLGPALFMDMARYLRVRSTVAGATREQLGFEAFYSYLLPQFEGIDEVEGERLYKSVRRIVGGQNAQRLQSTLRSVLGLELLIRQPSASDEGQDVDDAVWSTEDSVEDEPAEV